jgi:hypothetical protein
MIEEYIADTATHMGIKLSKQYIVEGRRVGCLGVHLLNLACDEQIVSTLVYQTELDNLQDGTYSDRLETKIRSALSQLKRMLEP